MAAVHVLILGAGYIGRPLAESLRMSGHRTTCWVRSEASAAVLRGGGHAVVVGDLLDPWIWDGLMDDWDAVVFCASSSGGGPEAYQKIYGRGLQLALERGRGAKRFVYTSSTSVYGQNDGSWVTEESPVLAPDANSIVLQKAEDAVIASWGVVLRLSGIYGPGRAVYWSRYVLGGAQPPGDPERWVNMIHQEDAVSAIRHALEKDPVAGQVFNVTDNEPVRLRNLLEWLGKHRPAGVPVPGASSGSGAEAGKRRGATSKRISNEKLRKAGWVPKYPSFKEGYASLVEGGGI
jgi:nucleoside-diphosphate-sugar epimerase